MLKCGTCTSIKLTATFRLL